MLRSKHDSSRTIVTVENFDACVEEILQHEHRSFDTETTGLFPFQGDRLFSLIMATESGSYYFNFQDYGDRTTVLPRPLSQRCQSLFDGPGLLFAHNAKFDWHMLNREGIEIYTDVWCTLVGARVLYNNHMNYSLNTCAERIGLAKDDAVEEYITDHKLWEWKTIPGKRTRVKDKHFDQVPFDVMVPYGHQDAEVTLALGLSQIGEIKNLDLGRPTNKPALMDVAIDELGVTRACRRIERRGVRIDPGYCEAAATHYELIYKQEVDRFEKLTGMPHKDSGKCYSQAFTNMGYKVPLNKNGNPTFDDAVLTRIDNPVCDIIKKIRVSGQRAGTYFRSYLHFADEQNIIHANMKSGGTVTGRFSYADPNFQNIPKRGDEEKKGPYPVRKAILPHEGECLVAIDYKQQELRLMFDYAKEMEVIEEIKNGHDPHDATAKMVNIDRHHAKKLNFGIPYGMGYDLLALELGCSREEAIRFKMKYFARLPRVEEFLDTSKRTAAMRGFVYDWAGGRHHYPDPRFAYKAGNSIIQGGCARITKRAMIALDKFLIEYDTSMIMQIHDEILFSVPAHELHIIPDLKRIMEQVYPYKYLPMECSVEHSWETFGEMVSGFPGRLVA